MTDTSVPNAEPLRLNSLDAMRGFDMFWIIGGAELVRGFVSVFDYPSLFHFPFLQGWQQYLSGWLEVNTEHPEWNGYTPWDQIFPMFMFIAGVAMPFSLTKRLERGDNAAKLHWHVIRRGLTLVLFGAIYNGLLLFHFRTTRYPSVLGRIGLGYMFAGLIVLHTKPRGQLLAILGILIGYYAALKWIPVPDDVMRWNPQMVREFLEQCIAAGNIDSQMLGRIHDVLNVLQDPKVVVANLDPTVLEWIRNHGIGAGNWNPGMTLGDYIDRMLIPGRLYKHVRDPEGLFSTIPAIATVLSGALAGHWLRSENRTGSAKVVGLVVAGIACVVLAILWSGVAYQPDKNLPVPLAINQPWAFWFPINKNLWTSSFVLYTSGWSLLVLSFFYLTIDVWGFRRWSFFFVVIGMNAITIYLTREFVNFDNIAHLVFRGTPEKSWSIDYRIIAGGGEVFIEWAFLYVLYRMGIFLRV